MKRHASRQSPQLCPIKDWCPIKTGRPPCGREHRDDTGAAVAPSSVRSIEHDSRTSRPLATVGGVGPEEDVCPGRPPALSLSRRTRDERGTRRPVTHRTASTPSRDHAINRTSAQSSEGGARSETARARRPVREPRSLRFDETEGWDSPLEVEPASGHSTRVIGADSSHPSRRCTGAADPGGSWWRVGLRVRASCGSGMV